MFRKHICLWMPVLLLLCLVLPVSAAQEPVITRQLQNPTYPEYAVAEYSVTVNGSNLRCFWYLKYEGKTYNISDMTNGNEPWEYYAGETYGPTESKNGNFVTFTYFFGGIEAPLDGAQIYPVIEDGHFEVTGDSAVISINENAAMPPKIAVPAGMEVFKGDNLDLYCDASSNTGSKLSYLWYETKTGKLQDITAINKGAEVSDTLHCDTSSAGTRYYVCMVTTEEGGSAYSSVIPVEVIEQAAIDPPTIKSTSIPEAEAGQDYYFKLDCSDPDAVFSIWYDPGKANDFDSTGLNLTQHGELEGTPRTAGVFYFTVMASNNGGEGYQRLKLTVAEGTTIELVNAPDKVKYFSGEKLDMTGLKVLIHENGKTVESLNGDKLTYSNKALVTLGEQKIKLTYKDAVEFFIVTVKEAPTEPTTEPVNVTEPTGETEPGKTESTNQATEEPTQTPTESAQATPDEPEPQAESKGLPWWVVLLIGIGAAGVGGCATFLILKKRV